MSSGSSHFGNGVFTFLTESLHNKLVLWSLKDVGIYQASQETLSSCVMVSVGPSVFGDWPILLLYTLHWFYTFFCMCLCKSPQLNVSEMLNHQCTPLMFEVNIGLLLEIAYWLAIFSISDFNGSILSDYILYSWSILCWWWVKQRLNWISCKVTHDHTPRK